ncbi:MAG: TlpA family protein disulfide reductase [Chlorobi bacterium]|nr:TlpA family protein disulfide reductase [Chlorobiota bacterium]
MQKRLLVLYVLILLSGSIFAQKSPVIIKGEAKEYAGFNLTLQYISDFITGKKTELGVIHIDDNGKFNISLTINEITYAFMDLGAMRGYIYLEPGTTYNIILPPYTPKKEADKFNPYFKPEEIVLGITNNDAQKLNKTITNFDDEFNYLFNKNAYRLLSGNGLKLSKEIIAHLDSVFPADKNTFFEQYKKFRYVKLFILSRKRQKRLIVNEYFTHSPVLYNNPAYTESFMLMFKNFLQAYFVQKRGIKLKQAFIDGASFDTLSVTLGSDTLYRNREFREIVLLKGLFDAYYSDTYDKDKIIALTEQAIQTGSTEKIKETANDIYKKITHLRPGTKAPDFTVYTLKGKEKTLDSYKGRFVYLNFANIENYACKKDFQLLNTLSRKMRRDLTIVTVITNKDLKEVTSFINKNKYRWEFLFLGDRGNILFDYNISTLPAYFLIDPDGNLQLSPAPSPEENFYARFYEALRNYRYKKARKEKPAGKSIYDL